MSKEKTPAATGASTAEAVGQLSCGKGSKRRGRVKPQCAPRLLPYVEFYREGVVFHKPVKGSNGGKRGKRSVIVGWSRSSRRRMREWMVAHTCPEGWGTLGLTLTIPGPPLSLQDTRALWKDFCRCVERAGWAMVWRIELQKRLSLHWHCLLIQPKPCHPADVSIMWAECLHRLGPVLHETKRGPVIDCRDRLPGADVHACQAEMGGNRGAWMRYLQDHQSKAKQEQIPESIGRHWGVVGRRHFVEAPSIRADLTPAQYSRVVRWWRRLATPMRPCEGAPFGRALSFGPSRGMWGRAVSFSRPETVARMADYAVNLDKGAAPGRRLAGPVGRLP